MKKITVVLLLCAMAVSLCACGKGGGDQVSAPAATQGTSPELEASASDAAASAQTHVPPASSSDVQTSGGIEDTPEYMAAENCLGLSVEELYAAIGQPVSEPEYGPSCLEDGAEDGMLYYDGFYVWTVRTTEGETVHAVYPDE